MDFMDKVLTTITLVCVCAASVSLCIAAIYSIFDRMYSDAQSRKKIKKKDR